MADPKTSDAYHQRRLTIGYGKASYKDKNKLTLCSQLIKQCGSDKLIKVERLLV
jgi:hypothetical protein